MDECRRCENVIRENQRLLSENRGLRHAIGMAIKFMSDNLGRSANAALVASWRQYLLHSIEQADSPPAAPSVPDACGQGVAVDPPQT